MMRGGIQRSNQPNSSYRSLQMCLFQRRTTQISLDLIWRMISAESQYLTRLDMKETYMTQMGPKTQPIVDTQITPPRKDGIIRMENWPGIMSPIDIPMSDGCCLIQFIKEKTGNPIGNEHTKAEERPGDGDDLPPDIFRETDEARDHPYGRSGDPVGDKSAAMEPSPSLVIRKYAQMGNRSPDDGNLAGVRFRTGNSIWNTRGNR